MIYNVIATSRHAHIYIYICVHQHQMTSKAEPQCLDIVLKCSCFIVTWHSSISSMLQCHVDFPRSSLATIIRRVFSSTFGRGPGLRSAKPRSHPGRGPLYACRSVSARHKKYLEKVAEPPEPPMF